VEEANLRRVMFEQSKKRYLLCDSSKFGKTYFYNMGSVSEVDDVISDAELPGSVRSLVKGK
jgi:DeoR/GlpR family transcriptional regulator of sugar metabolism